MNTTEGLLLNDATHIVKNYHKDTLPDRKELTIQAYENIFVTDDNFDKDQTSLLNLIVIIILLKILTKVLLQCYPY